MNSKLVDWVPVRGNTYPVKEQLKRECRARWIAADKTWMVPSTYLDLAVSIVGGLPKTVTNGEPKPTIIFSDEQTRIIEWIRTSVVEGVTCRTLVVRARAGTGKTFTIVEGLKYAPENTMLYAVFGTLNKAEASEKITDPRVSVMTLHACGYRLIRRVWPKAIVDEDNQIEWDRIHSAVGTIPDEVAGELYKLVGFCKNVFCGIPSLNEVIEVAEGRMIECENFEKPEDGGWTVERLSEVAIQVLELSMIPDSLNRISFNDMVWLPVAMNWVVAMFPFVVIDEAQDMNAPQLRMAMLLSSGRVMVVGDDRQAIFEFRGAVQNGIDMMKRELKAEEAGLTATRRCGIEIVAEAQKYVPDIKSAPGAHHAVVDEICGSKLQQTARPGDAILSRVRAPMMSICLSFIRQGVPCRIQGRDVGAELLNTVKKLKARSIPEVIRKTEAWGTRMIKRSNGKEAKIQVIKDTVETIIALVEGLSSVGEIEARVKAIFSDSRNPNGAIVCSTTHKAKGLEWNRVFVLSSTFKFNGPQENNLRYVAITRAKRHLTFVDSRLNVSAV